MDSQSAPSAQVDVTKISAELRRLLAAIAPMEDNAPLLFNTRQAAKYLGWSVVTLERKRSEGTGPQFSRIGRSVVYSKADLVAFVAMLPKFRSVYEADFPWLKDRLAKPRSTTGNE